MKMAVKNSNVFLHYLQPILTLILIYIFRVVNSSLIPAQYQKKGEKLSLCHDFFVPVGAIRWTYFNGKS